MVEREELHAIRSTAGKEWGPDFNENGVHPRTHAFLVDAVDSEALDRLSVDERNLLAMYYGTGATFFDLTRIIHPHAPNVQYSTVLDRVQCGVRRAIERLWEFSPEELKNEHPHDRVIMMKGQAQYVKTKQRTAKNPFSGAKWPK